MKVQPANFCAISGIWKYNCYCDVRIWTGLGGRNICSVPRSNLESWWFERGIFNASSGLEAKSLKMKGYPLSFLRKGVQSNRQTINLWYSSHLNFDVLLFSYIFVLLGIKLKKSWVSKKIYNHKKHKLVGFFTALFQKMGCIFT